jgi:hypothetical protein
VAGAVVAVVVPPQAVSIMVATIMMLARTNSVRFIFFSFSLNKFGWNLVSAGNRRFTCYN